MPALKRSDRFDSESTSSTIAFEYSAIGGFSLCLYGYVGNLIVLLVTLNPSELPLMCTGLTNNHVKYLRLFLLLLTTRPVVGKGASFPRVVLSSFPPCCIVFGFSVLHIIREVG